MVEKEGWDKSQKPGLGISAGPPPSLSLGHLLKKFSKTQQDNKWMKFSWISSAALLPKDPGSPALPHLCYISFMEGCYCPVLSGKQTIDLHLSQRSHVMVLPSRNSRWQLLPHSHPLYQGAQGLGLSYWLCFPRHCCYWLALRHLHWATLFFLLIDYESQGIACH